MNRRGVLIGKIVVGFPVLLMTLFISIIFVVLAGFIILLSGPASVSGIVGLQQGEIFYKEIVIGGEKMSLVHGLIEGKDVREGLRNSFFDEKGENCFILSDKNNFKESLKIIDGSVEQGSARDIFNYWEIGLLKNFELSIVTREGIVNLDYEYYFGRCYSLDEVRKIIQEGGRV
jgi:hypothetical protein